MSQMCNLTLDVYIPYSKLIINFSLMGNLSERLNKIHKNAQVKLLQYIKTLSHINNVLTLFIRFSP